jgi:fluoroquinolone transport system ATP-binding protein
VEVEYGADGGMRRESFDLDGLAEQPRFLDLLRSGTIQTIHTQETTLENIFIEVTGRTLA